jgi:hypothetical protein
MDRTLHSENEFSFLPFIDHQVPRLAKLTELTKTLFIFRLQTNNMTTALSALSHSVAAQSSWRGTKTLVGCFRANA